MGEPMQHLVRTLWRLGEDRQSAGFLGMIGMGSASLYDVQFRLYVRLVAAYVADRFRDPGFGLPAAEVETFLLAISTSFACRARDGWGGA